MAHGLDATAHRPRQIDRGLLRAADLVLVMENHHREDVHAVDVTARGKTFLLGHWLGQRPIVDPYGRDRMAFEAAFADIDAAADAWVSRL